MGIINITGIRLYAYHGCHEEESIIGGNYIVDIKIETDFEEAALKDDLSKTVDYDYVYEIVKNEMGVRSKLIESVAKRIADKLYNQIKGITEAKITVCKLNPPVSGEVEKISVEYIARKK